MNTTTTKAIKLIAQHFTKKEFAEEVGITRPTLNKKLETDKWKKLERKEISRLYQKYFESTQST